MCVASYVGAKASISQASYLALRGQLSQMCDTNMHLVKSTSG